MEQERKTNDLTNNIRDAARSRAEEALGRLSSAAAGDGASAGGGGDGAARRAEVAVLKRKLENAVAVMQKGLVERDAEVRLLLLAAMAGEHILLIGPPGTAKSEVGRRLNSLIRGAYFERLLTRFSVPEELFGPLSMRALEEDKYIRQVDGYLPTAEVAFIDEIFKANSAILNTLLTLINERLFDNGNVRERVPLISMVGASNELPESEELDALYDRFLVRRQVKQVSPSGVADMLSYYSSSAAAAASDGGAAAAGGAAAGGGGEDLRLSRDDILRCKAAAVSSVRVPQSVIQLVVDLRTYLQEKVEPPVYVSDRRLVKSIQLLQVAAYCNGRASVTEFDCLLLQHVLWQKPEQADRIADWVVAQLSVDDGLQQSEFLLRGLFNRACRIYGDQAKVQDVRSELGSLVDLLLGKYAAVAGNLSGGFPVVLDNLWLGAEESEAVATSLEPRLAKTREAVIALLGNAMVLDEALRQGADAVTFANLLPKYWADFIRNADMADVKPMGTSPLAGGARSSPFAARP